MKKILNPVMAALALAAIASLALAHGDHPTSGSSAVTVPVQRAWGVAGDAKAVSRTVTLVMDDKMRFTPDKLLFKQGETVRFVIRNQGKLLHEMVIGTKKELDEHAAMMLKSPAMQHAEPSMVHVAAGKTGGMVWTFNRAGDFDFACLIAGHYQAGMVGKISVTAASS
ncbi:MAG: cupredoxin family protein [Pseudomonadota bacterium]